ncbi:hypothetical protein JOE62_003108 [Glutamicibacter nicotianae]|nr:hypothetical protein [Glutamicibacter nicotianae]
MSLAGLVVWEHVKDPEGRCIELQGEPGSRAFFLLDNGARATEKLRDFLFFAWLGSQFSAMSEAFSMLCSAWSFWMVISCFS